MLRVRKEAFLPLPLRNDHRAVLDAVQLCEEVRAECATAARDLESVLAQARARLAQNSEAMQLFNDTIDAAKFAG